MVEEVSLIQRFTVVEVFEVEKWKKLNFEKKCFKIWYLNFYISMSNPKKLNSSKNNLSEIEFGRLILRLINWVLALIWFFFLKVLTFFRAGIVASKVLKKICTFRTLFRSDFRVLSSQFSFVRLFYSLFGWFSIGMKTLIELRKVDDNFSGTYNKN